MPTPALTNPPAAPRNWKKIGLIALAVAVILALLVGSFALGGRVNNAPSTPTSSRARRVCGVISSFIREMAAQLG